MKKGFVLLLVSLFLIPYLGSSYASDRKKKKKAPIEQKNVTPKKPYPNTKNCLKGNNLKPSLVNSPRFTGLETKSIWSTR